MDRTIPVGETVRARSRPGGGLQYDAFISYSHAADGQLAPAIQTGLQRLAKPWTKRRALRVFRDETGLSVNPHLWESIVGALDSAEWFVVLASPEAAESAWVNREIEHFLATRPDARERLLPIVTDGIWEWDEAAGTFTAATTCVPPALAAAFDSEPRHLDLSWARQDDHLHLRRADFRSAIADIAAPIHGLPKDELESEDIRIYRRNRRLRRGAVSSLVLLTAGLGIASCAAFGFARNAQRERNNAEASAVEAERQAEIAKLREGEALDAEAAALASANEAARQEAIAVQRADEARVAQAEAVASAEEAARQEALALQREQEALDAEAAAVAAQRETEAALARVIEEQERADENARQAEANAEEARANADEAQANAEEARANADEAKRQADEAKRQQTIAEVNATTSRSRALASQSLEFVERDPELAVLTALEAVYPDGVSDRHATADARGALGVALRTLLTSPARRTGIRIDGLVAVDPLSGTTASVTGTTITVSPGGTGFGSAVRRIDVGAAPAEMWFSPGGDVIAVATVEVPGTEHTRTVYATKMFDARSGRQLNSFTDLSRWIGDLRDDRPVQVDFDRQGERFLVDRDDHVAIVDTATGRTMVELRKPTLPGCDLATFGNVTPGFDASGTRVVGVEESFEQFDCASVGAPGDPRILAWELSAPDQPIAATLDVAPVRAWWVREPAGTPVVAFVDESANAWWWTPGSEPRVAYRVRSDTVITVEPNLDTGQFALVDVDGALYVGSMWDATSRAPMQYALDPRLQWQRGRELLVADGPGVTSQFRVTDATDLLRHDAIDPSGERRFVGGTVTRTSDGEVLWTYDPDPFSFAGDHPVAVARDGSIVVTQDGSIVDAATGAVTVRLPNRSIASALFADRGGVVLVAGHAALEHYDSTTGELLAESPAARAFAVSASTASIFELALPAPAPDERSVATVGVDGGVWVSDVRSGATRELDLPGSATSVTWVDAERLAVGFVDGAVRVVSAADGRQVGTPLVGLNGPIHGLAADPSGERVFAFDTKRTPFGIDFSVAGSRAVVWDISTGGALQVFDHPAIVRGTQRAPAGGIWRLEGPHWTYLPDADVAVACEEALAVAGDELERLLGHPSVCTTIPELRS